MQNAETVLDVIGSLESGVRGNLHAPFGNRPTEKDPNQGHLAGGRVHSERAGR
jgi:hypothetical protein